MIKENQKEFQICNIPLWWSLGYTGKGIKVAEIETAYEDCQIYNGKLLDPFNIGDIDDANEHGGKVLDVIHQVAPDSLLYELPSGIYFENSKVKGGFVEKTLPFAITEGIDIINASLGGIDNDLLNVEIQKAIDKGTIFSCSAGNQGNRGLDSFALSNKWISWGAINENGIIADYSSRGKDLDFVGFSGLYVYNEKDPTLTMCMAGTSFSAPFGSGMMALVQQFFFEKSGKKLNQEQMYQFIKDHTVDKGEQDFDETYGYGLFVLPHPDSIDIKKYIGGNNVVIKMQIGSNKYTVDGVEKVMDTAPMQDGNYRTEIPVRFVAEALGASVEWDEETKTVTITR